MSHHQPYNTRSLLFFVFQLRSIQNNIKSPRNIKPPYEKKLRVNKKAERHIKIKKYINTQREFIMSR